MRNLDIEKRMLMAVDKLLNWTYLNRHKILSVAILTIFLTSLSLFPYINLILGRDLIVLVVILSCVIIFGVRANRVIAAALLSIIVSVPFVLIEEYELAELLANFSYAFLLLGVIKFILEKDVR